MEKKETIIIICIVAVIVAFSVWRDNRDDAPESAAPSASVSAQSGAAIVAEPVGDALRRITKKPFGIRVSPQDSPVSPERFAGYHTGTDFETFTDEQDVDIAVFAVCSGRLLQKNVSSGYGGVLVQSCTIDGRAVTVLYGHVRLTSVTAAVGQEVVAGKKIAVLGSGYSGETDGERKHLHLGIHIGTAIDVRGYVPTSNALTAWLNIADYLR